MIKPLRIGVRTYESIVRELDVLLRDVVAALNARRVTRLSCVIDTAVLPVSIELPSGVRPATLRLESAIAPSSGVVLSGGSLSWDAERAGVVTVHTLSALAASTRYDAVIAVEET